MNNPSQQLDLFPTSEPEIKGQLAAFAVVFGNLLELLIRKGVLTNAEAQTLCSHSDIQSSFAIWESLAGEVPPSDLKSMEAQATKFIAHLREKIGD